MQAERDQLQANVEELERHLLEAKRRISEVQTLAREQRLAAESCLIGTLRSETHESAAHMDAVQATEGSNPHPPGFKVLSQRVDKFSGRSGENHFDVWMLDFIEATEDCGWSDEQRARWFSWFLSGPTKSTWRHTLKSSEKTWDSIMEIYREQYGVHLDPRAAYQRCQELQYEQFSSVQGLQDAIRDYKLMAPISSLMMSLSLYYGLKYL